MRAPVNSTYVRKANRQKVLKQVYQRPGISRQDLAEEIGLTPPAISGIVKSWVSQMVIVEEGQGASGGGRRPVCLALRGDAAWALGAEISRKQIRFSVVNLNRKILEQYEWDLDMTDPEEGVANLATKVNELLEEERFANQLILGLGVATAGLYDVNSQCIRRSINLGAAWDQLDLMKLLQKYISLPIRIENNSNACALAEFFLIQEEKISELVWIHLGEGISAGLIQDGRWVRGRSNYSGEIGHITLHSKGRLCNCGNAGCIEAYWGWNGIKKSLEEAGYFENSAEAEKFTMKEWLDLVAQEDPLAVNIAREMGKDIGKIVAQVVNVLNPTRVFLGGPLRGTLEYYLDDLCRVVKEEAFPDIGKETKVTFSILAKYAGSLGACSLILQEALQEPQSEIFALLEGDDHHEI